MREEAASAGTTRRRLETPVFVALGTLVLLTQLGYSFETRDQLQYLLLPYREMYPNFLPGDWFTWNTTHYHQSYSWLIRALYAVVGGDGLPWAVFACHLIVLAGLAAALLAWSRAWGFGTVSAAVALGVMAVVRPLAIGGATLNHGELLPSDMALPPLMLAFAAWLERRPLRAGVWLGLSALLHANFAVLGAAVLFPLAVVDAIRSRTPKAFLIMVAGYAPLAAPTLALVAQSFLSTDAAPDAVWLALRVRAPHHYVLAEMSPGDFAWPALLFACGLPVWWKGTWSAGRARNQWLFGALVVLLLLGLAGSLLESLPVVRAFLWRLSVPLCVVLLFIVGETARGIVARRDVAGLVWLGACCAAIAPFARTDVVGAGSWESSVPTFALATFVPLVLAGLWLAHSPRVNPWLLAALLVVPVAWSVRAVSAPLVVEHGEDPEQVRAKLRGLRLAPVRVRQELGSMFARIRAETPTHASFLIPPSLDEFRLRARRTIYVDWKCVPMKGEEALEWKRRMLATLGVREFPATGYTLHDRAEDIYVARDLRQLEALARREGLDYVVAPKEALHGPGLRRMMAGGTWRVYGVRSATEKRMYEKLLRRNVRLGLPMPERMYAPETLDNPGPSR